MEASEGASRQKCEQLLYVLMGGEVFTGGLWLELMERCD